MLLAQLRLLLIVRLLLLRRHFLPSCAQNLRNVWIVHVGKLGEYFPSLILCPDHKRIHWPFYMFICTLSRLAIDLCLKGRCRLWNQSKLDNAKSAAETGHFGAAWGPKIPSHAWIKESDNWKSEIGTYGLLQSVRCSSCAAFPELRGVKTCHRKKLNTHMHITIVATVNGFFWRADMGTWLFQLLLLLKQLISTLLLLLCRHRRRLMMLCETGKVLDARPLESIDGRIWQLRGCRRAMWTAEPEFWG